MTYIRAGYRSKAVLGGGYMSGVDMGYGWGGYSSGGGYGSGRGGNGLYEGKSAAGGKF